MKREKRFQLSGSEPHFRAECNALHISRIEFELALRKELPRMIRCNFELETEEMTDCGATDRLKFGGVTQNARK
jgi:hypothetical protein